MTTSVGAETGPLTSTAELHEPDLFATNTDAALWLAFVGLGGHVAWVPEHRRWMRHTGWRSCHRGDIQAAVRQGLHAVYERRMGQSPQPKR